VNLYVIFSREPNVLLEKWRARDRRMFDEANGIAAIKAFLNSTRPVRVWYKISFRSNSGMLEMPGILVAASCGVSTGYSC